MATHHGHVHHPAAPATPVTPPPPQWQPLNWCFPFPPAGGDSADPQTWLRALADTDGGFYPLGLNGMYHGGIHFDAGTAGKLKQGDGVRAIADGEVVAYQLDSAYPELTYPTTPPRYALYSSGFVLVRHRLVLPPEPKREASPAGASGASAPTTAATPASAIGTQTPQSYQPPVDEVLEFYSLYMHQLDWKGYQHAAQPGNGGTQSTPPVHPLPFWQGDRRFRVGAKANDHQARPPQLNTPFRFDMASAGSSASPLGNGAQVESIAAGPSPDSLGALVPQADSRLRYGLLPDVAGVSDAPRSAQGARILDHANGTVIGLLPRGGELCIVGNIAKGWAQIATITKGTPVAAVVDGTPNPLAASGWVNLDELDAVVDPKPRDAVVVLDKPYPVKAGDVVGHMGEYQTSSEASMLPPKLNRPLLHVEVFTGAKINDFISKSKKRAATLPDSGKTLLVIQRGAKLADAVGPQWNTGLAGLTLVPMKGNNGDPGKGRWAKVQPTHIAAQSGAHGHGHRHHQQASSTPAGNPLWVERKYAGKVASAAIQTWTDFPLQLANAMEPAVEFPQAFSRAQLEQFSATNKAVDEQGMQWWQIEAGDSDGRTMSGWVREKSHPDTQWESPWAWPGFDTVDTTDIPLIDMYRRNLFEAKRLIEGDNEKEFNTVAATVNAGAFIGKLERAAKRQGNDKGNVKPTDLRAALMTSWLAGAVSHLIFRYESEWGGDMSKWEALSRLIGNGKQIWQTELERIEKLQWWDKVKAVKGFPDSADVWHIHPIGLVGNFYQNMKIPVDCYEFQTSEGIFKVSKRAFQLILSSEGYGPKPYVPEGDQSSGVTVGYGYDLGQQTIVTIEADLSGIFTPDQIERLAQASGKHGNTARNLVPSLADISISPDMAMRLAVVMKRRFAQQTVDAFPSITSLHPHCQGALLSLVINRGPGMQDKPGQKTREHMRAIRSDMASRNYSDIPVQLRDMKNLWDPGMQRGLLIRRDQEAALFSDGIDNSTAG